LFQESLQVTQTDLISQRYVSFIGNMKDKSKSSFKISRKPVYCQLLHDNLNLRARPCRPCDQVATFVQPVEQPNHKGS